MEDIITRLEKIADKLTKDKSYVYILEKYECYDRWSNIVGCYDTPEKTYDAAGYILDWISFSLDDIINLNENSSIESDDRNNILIKVYKFAIQ